MKRNLLFILMAVCFVLVTVPGCDFSEDDPAPEDNKTIDVYIDNNNLNEVTITNVSVGTTNYGSLDYEETLHINLATGTYDVSWYYYGFRYSEEITVLSGCGGDAGFWIDVMGTYADNSCD